MSLVYNLTYKKRKKAELMITRQPENIIVSLGDPASFTIEATGEGTITYQWYFRNADQTKFTKTLSVQTYTTAESSLAMDGREVYCVVTDSYGRMIESNHVFMTVVKSEPEPDIDYVYFTSNTNFSVWSEGTYTTPNLEYSYDKNIWHPFAWGYKSDDTLEIIGCNAGEKIYFRGLGNTGLNLEGTNSRFCFNGENIECGGNIETLLDYQTAENGDTLTLSPYCYRLLFVNCTSLISAKQLMIPTTATHSCESMFSGCSNLTEAPLLSAKTVHAWCYYKMFSGCTSLQVAPALPAMNVSSAPSCYYMMFEICSNLETIPRLPSTDLSSYCYYQMFIRCSKVHLSKNVESMCDIPYRIENSLTDSSAWNNALSSMFSYTASSIGSPNPILYSEGTPEPNVTYYTYSVIEPDGTILTSEPAHIYGASWDGTSITKKWTRTDEAANFADPVPYVSGATEYGSPFDDLYPWKDMTIVEDDDAGTMVKIPKFWYKLTQNGDGMSIQIADKEVEGYSVCPACMDRGDGNGERDYILFGRYHCASFTYKSKTSELPAANATRADFCTSIQALGTGIYMTDWAARFTIWLLYLVEFADWDSQATIGYGCGNNSSTESMGYTDSMPYHTGTMQASRTIYGLGTQYRNIEGLWDNVRDYIDGCYNSSAGLNIILDPTKFSDSENGISVGTPTSYGPTAFSVKAIDNIFPLFIPSADGVNYVDRWYFNSSTPIIVAGGSYYSTYIYGMFYFGNVTQSYTHPSAGSRPMKLPNFTSN